jgi:hypothetical protein
LSSSLVERLIGWPVRYCLQLNGDSRAVDDGLINIETKIIWTFFGLLKKLFILVLLPPKSVIAIA